MKLSRSPGFSLVELLVSLAIVAILVALGFSAFSSLGKRRDETTCLNNLRQVYMLLQSYAADHAGRYPPASSNADGDVTLHWRRAILPYMGMKAEGDGVEADVFHSNLVCPAAAKNPAVPEAFRKLSNFGLNENLGDPNAPLERGIPASRIREPARFFLATETIYKTSGLPRESLRPKDFNTYATALGHHRRKAQNVLYGDGRVEMLDDVRVLIMPPYAVGKPEDVWTP